MRTSDLIDDVMHTRCKQHIGYYNSGRELHVGKGNKDNKTDTATAGITSFL
jgi:hypothetical protein